MTNMEETCLAATFEATDLAKQIAPMLQDREFEVVGAVLAQLLAVFIAGHIPPLRERAAQLVVEGAELMVPVILDEIETDRRPQQ
jgi:hypothetical protein